MPGNYYVWASPGKGVAVHLSLPLVDNLSSRLPIDREMHGVLLGRVRQRDHEIRVIIDDYEPFTEPPQKFEPIRDRIPVGLFRSSPGVGLNLEASDAQTIERLFHSPELVFLLIRTTSGEPPRAAFFIQEKGKIQGYAAYREFPFHADLLRNGAFPLSDGLHSHDEDTPVPRRNIVNAALAGVAVGLVAVGLWAVVKRPAARQKVETAATTPAPSQTVAPTFPAPAVTPPAPTAREKPKPKPAKSEADRQKPTRDDGSPEISFEPVTPSRFRRLLRRPFKSRETFTAAKPLRRPVPPLPEEIASAITSPVPIALRLHIDDRGRVTQSKVVTNSHHPKLAKFAAAAARSWRFQSARVNDEPVPSDLVVHMKFDETAR
jgi:hypothetical protein